MKTRFFIIIILGIIFSEGLYAQENDAFHSIPKHPVIESYRFPLLPSPSKYIPLKASITQTNYFLTLRDGVQLDCSKFYPQVSNPYLPNGYPVVVMCHGYGDRKETLQNFAIAQAQYGYVVYTFSMRGQGNSGGLSNLISDTEADDLIELINYIRADTITHSDTSKILIMGGSQGGIIPVKASIRGMKVNTIISALASPVFATSWMENGCIKMTYAWSLSYTSANVRYNNQTKALNTWIYKTGTKNDKWDSLATYTPINRDFINNIANIKSPVLIENSWQDYFFNASGVYNALPQIPVKTMAYFGAVVGHGGDTSATENAWHMNFFNDWFYYFLYGVNNGLFTTRPRYHFAYTTYPRVNNMWSFTHDSSFVFPPQGFNPVRYYFANNKNLNTAVIQSPIKEVSFQNNVIDKKLTMQQAVDYEFTGATFDSKFKKDTIYFETAPFTSSTKLFGTPKLTLKYRSNANICQFNLQISEVTSSGQVNMISRINYTDRKYTPNINKTAVINGISFAHSFQKGSKIRIVVTNLDTHWQDYLFLRTNPFVLPVLVKSTNTIILNSSYIELPLSSTVTASRENLNSDNISTDDDTQLYQNSPNPFNPSTNIKFALPQGFNGQVSLKIYDITGRLVSQLVNQNMSGGIHEVSWNADKLSSGIYFYKLLAGSFSDIKKMMYIK